MAILTCLLGTENLTLHHILIPHPSRRIALSTVFHYTVNQLGFLSVPGTSRWLPNLPAEREEERETDPKDNYLTSRTKHITKRQSELLVAMPGTGLCPETEEITATTGGGDLLSSANESPGDHE